MKHVVVGPWIGYEGSFEEERVCGTGYEWRHIQSTSWGRYETSPRAWHNMLGNTQYDKKWRLKPGVTCTLEGDRGYWHLSHGKPLGERLRTYKANKDFR